jgi:hypothetical protein
MPCNRDGACNDASTTNDHLNVNGTWVITFAAASGKTGAARAQEAANRLNAIFADWATTPSRDLDFITPSYHTANGGYCVVCPRVRYPSGPTYFHTDCGFSCPPDGYPARLNASPCAAGSTRCLPENIYDQDITTDTLLLGQTMITPVRPEDATLQGMPIWEVALVFANNIRGALNPASGDALGRSVQRLPDAVNSTPPGQVIWQGAATVYGDPDQPFLQGSEQNNLNNICCLTVANGEIFHTDDLTIALPSSSYATRANQWVQVCYLNNPCVAARVTDNSGTQSPDLSYGGIARAIGFPTSGSLTIKTMD